MVQIEGNTKSQSEAILTKAIRFFGPNGLGLKMIEKTDCFARFVGGGGHVRVLVHEGLDSNKVVVESREWDYHAKRFLQEL